MSKTNSWPRAQFAGPRGGLYSGPGGRLSTGKRSSPGKQSSKSSKRRHRRTDVNASASDNPHHAESIDVVESYLNPVDNWKELKNTYVRLSQLKKILTE